MWLNASTGSFRYTPYVTASESYSGSDSFTFRANDGQADSNTATITVTVNHRPRARNLAFTLNWKTTYSGTLATGGADSLNHAYTFEQVSGTSNGTLSLNSDGTFTYAPTGTYTGADSFTYRVNDGTITSATATVSLTVSSSPVRISSTSPMGMISSIDVIDGNLYFSNIFSSVSRPVRYDGDTFTVLTEANTTTTFSKFGSNIYFYADDASSHTKLFRFDGTSSTQFSNTNPGGYDSPSVPFAHNGKIYFASNDTSSHSKLWVSDGSTPTQLANTNSGGNDYPSLFTTVGSNLYFTSATSVGRKLFKYDGTSVAQVSNTFSGGDDSPTKLVAVGSNLFFSSQTSSGVTKLFKYDGTSVTQVSNTNSSGSDGINVVKAQGTRLYFTAKTSNTGLLKLFYTDGTSVTSVTTSALNGNGIGTLTVMGSNLYYADMDGSSHVKLFKYDGTSSTAISNTYPGGHDLNYSTQPIVSGSKLYFAGSINSTDYKMFMYDGTSVTQISNTRPGKSDSPIIALATIGDSAYFTAWGSDGVALYRYDGTSTKRIQAPSPTWDDIVQSVAAASSSLYFRASMGNINYSTIFSYDGSTVSNRYDDLQAFDPHGLTTSNTSLAYATFGGSSYIPFVFDGSTTTNLNSLNAGISDPQYFTTLGSQLVFNGYDSTGNCRKIFAYDGSALNTVSDCLPDLTGSDPPQAPVVVGTSAFFTCYDGNGSTKLCAYDGTSAAPVWDFNPGSDDFPTTLTAVGSRLAFQATSDQKAFVYDSGSVSQLPETNSGSFDAPFAFSGIGTNLFYASLDSGSVWELYKVVGVGTPSPLGLTGISWTIAYGTQLIASGLDASNHRKLFMYDGTSLTQISNTFNNNNDDPSDPRIAAGKLYFTASNANGKSKLYRYDGTSVTQVVDLAGATKNDSPTDVTEFGSDVYFQARDSRGFSGLYRLVE